MRVRVKEEMSGFIYGVLRTEGKEFNLKPVKHSTEKDSKGKPVIISIKQQFSDVWMEEVKKGSVESDDSDETEEETEDNDVDVDVDVDVEDETDTDTDTEDDVEETVKKKAKKKASKKKKVNKKKA